MKMSDDNYKITLNTKVLSKRSHRKVTLSNIMIIFTSYKRKETLVKW